jgi:DNA (cytosine-5)-methyltransferase 1
MPSRKTTAPKFVAIDFFCGAGGTTRGLIDAGGYVSAGIDNDKRCELTYVTNNPNTKGDRARPAFIGLDLLPATPNHPSGRQAHVRERISSIVSNLRGRWPEAPLLFSITAPCQPFTKLAAQTGISTKRHIVRQRDTDLLLESSSFVEWFKPDIVFVENVPGIRGARYQGVWQTFEKKLLNLGYVVGSKVVCASKFGIPQYRKRAVLLAIRCTKLPQRSIAQDKILIPDRDTKSEITTVREAIGHLPPVEAGRAHPLIPNHRARALSRINLKRMASSIPGESNENMHATKFGNLSLNCHADLAERMQEAGFKDVYTRMHPDRPAPTITTRCNSISNGRYGHYDTSQLRAITPREAAILQSFPESYVFYPSEQTEFAARMIGNAVPPKLARFFAGYALQLMGLVRKRESTTRVARQTMLPLEQAELS